MRLPAQSGWKPREIAFGVWCVLSLAATLAIPRLLQASFPLFTVIWILIPALTVAVTKDASRVGFRGISKREWILVAAINLAVLLGIMIVFEPWTHTYRTLVDAAVSQSQPDTTFAWLIRFPRLPALGGMLLYSGAVTLFGEELFFRGWLLQLLKKRLSAVWAVFFQALLFAVLNLFAVLVLTPLQGVVYILFYTWLGIGMVGGWAASRTGSIWPSLVSATLCNWVLVFLLTACG
jgi:membrane protease YdiL (CAAX protease family)